MSVHEHKDNCISSCDVSSSAESLLPESNNVKDNQDIDEGVETVKPDIEEQSTNSEAKTESVSNPTPINWRNTGVGDDQLVNDRDDTRLTKSKLFDKRVP